MNVDIKLLKAQRDVLLDIDNPHPEIDGLINFLDSLLDIAHGYGTPCGVGLYLENGERIDG